LITAREGMDYYLGKAGLLPEKLFPGEDWNISWEGWINSNEGLVYHLMEGLIY
jgi:hypothetical protein